MEGIRMKMWLKKHAVGGVPSLLDLSVQAAIDNVRYMGDVGWTDIDLLGRILPHCKVDELKYIEDSTEGRDLSPVTDKLWKGFYKHEFGEESMNLVIKRMMSKNVTFKWRMLYEAKAKEREVAKKQSVDRLKQRYMEENDKKQSRQIQICSKVPPSGKKRSWSGGSGFNVSSVKGNLMKKSRLEFLNSNEVRNHAAIRNQKKFSSPSQRAPQYSRMGSSVGSSSASASQQAKPFGRW